MTKTLVAMLDNRNNKAITDNSLSMVIQHGGDEISCKQPIQQTRSQGLYSSHPLEQEGKKRDPGNEVADTKLSAFLI